MGSSFAIELFGIPCLLFVILRCVCDFTGALLDCDICTGIFDRRHFNNMDSTIIHSEGIITYCTSELKC
jgi:hypothetical protein